MKKILTLAVASLLVVALAVPALAGGKSEVAKATQKTDTSIAGIATSEQYGDSFDILVAALTETGLLAAIEKQNQKTVFAPTDDAFMNFFGADEDTIIGLIEAGAVADLDTILLYHVIPGRQASTSVLSNMEYDTLAGITLTQGELVAAGLLSEPVIVNLSASNGIVHVLTSSILTPGS